MCLTISTVAEEHYVNWEQKLGVVTNGLGVCFKLRTFFFFTKSKYKRQTSWMQKCLRLKWNLGINFLWY